MKESNGNLTKHIEDFYPLVGLIVSQVKRRLPHYADCEELHSAGVKGLVCAVQRHSSMEKEQLKRYLAVRIRGSIIDELRKNDSLSRTARKQARKFSQTESELRQRLRREPTESELREEMGLGLLEFQKLKTAIHSRIPIRLDDHSEDNERGAVPLRERLSNPSEMNPLQQVEKREMVSSLSAHMGKLGEREAFLIRKYYFEDWKLRDIARAFGVSEARACQLHSRALRSLRVALEQDSSGSGIAEKPVREEGSELCTENRG